MDVIHVVHMRHNIIYRVYVNYAWYHEEYVFHIVCMHQTEYVKQSIHYTVSGIYMVYAPYRLGSYIHKVNIFNNV